MLDFEVVQAMRVVDAWLQEMFQDAPVTIKYMPSTNDKWFVTDGNRFGYDKSLASAFQDYINSISALLKGDL